MFAPIAVSDYFLSYSIFLMQHRSRQEQFPGASIVTKDRLLLLARQFSMCYLAPK